MRGAGLIARGTAILIVLLLGGACRRPHGEPSTDPCDPRGAPVQAELDAKDPTASAPFTLDGARITPRARYRVAARVLSTERYYLGWQSTLSPVDLALGWGAMSDPAVDRFISWHQGTRWYFWRWSEESAYRNDEIAAQSANTHIVPANPNVRRAVFALTEGDVVRLQGLLIDIEGPAGERWRSSLSRADGGNGSCELLYVTEVITDGSVYR